MFIIKIAWVEFELANYDVTVYSSYYIHFRTNAL